MWTEAVLRGCGPLGRVAVPYDHTWRSGKPFALVSRLSPNHPSCVTLRRQSHRRVGKIVGTSIPIEDFIVSKNVGVAEDRPFLASQSRFVNERKSFLHVCFGAAAIALGLGFFGSSKPALAEDVVRPTLTATINHKGEVKLDESTVSDTESRAVDDDGMGSSKQIDADGTLRTEVNPGSSESAGKGFESLYGEGSDLATDPAEVLLRSFLESHPTDMKALQALLFLRLKKGEVDSSLSVLKTLIELEPENLEWKYIRAQAYEFAGNLPQARQGFEEVLESKPLSARVLQGLAVVMHKMGDDEDAQQLLVNAVKRAVDTGETKEAINLRMLLGQLHTMQGNLESAMELYKTVAEEDPNDYRPYLCQGLVYSILGDEAEAEKQFRSYRKLCPKDFPHRGFLDELMLKAKSEARMLNKRMTEEAELKKKGKKLPKAMQQPLASGGKQ